jgi:dTDP-4-dehydrorhamnose reductase
LAEAMTRDQGVEGIFHFADEGEASWFVLAEDVMREA